MPIYFLWEGLVGGWWLVMVVGGWLWCWGGCVVE